MGHTKHEGLDAENRAPALPAVRPGRDARSHGRRPHRRRPGAVRQPDAAGGAVGRSRPAVSGVRTMDELIAQSVGQRRLSMLLLSLFSGIALVLASLGIYGLMSYSVAQRLAGAGRPHRPRCGPGGRAPAGASPGDVARARRHRDRRRRSVRPRPGSSRASSTASRRPIRAPSSAWRCCSPAPRSRRI